MCWARTDYREITAGTRLSHLRGKLAGKHPWAGDIVHFKLNFWPTFVFKVLVWFYFFSKFLITKFLQKDPFENN